MEGLINGLVLSLAAVSVAIWMAIFRVWRRDGSILPFEPRRPVPWGPVGLIIAGIVFLVAALSGFIAAEDAPDPTASETITAILEDAFIKILVAGGVVAWLVISHRATREDFGLPRNWYEALSDSVLGVLATLAALVPVYIILNIFVWIFGDRPQNPLLTRILDEPSGAVLAAAFVSAVIVAPVFEEFVFRLLIQGWLEKILMPPRAFVGGGTSLNLSPEADPNAMAAVWDDRALSQASADVVLESGEEPISQTAADSPGNIRIVWLPILISSLLFSAAHFGFEYGYSPIPLFLLAVIFGYLYQRTHRILPCMVAHLVFNAISICLLWLQIRSNP